MAAGFSVNHANSDEEMRSSSLLFKTLFITLANIAFGFLGATFASTLLTGSSTLVKGLASAVPIKIAPVKLCAWCFRTLRTINEPIE